MCGISAIFNDKLKKAASTVFEGLKNLEYRGCNFWRIVTKKKKLILILKMSWEN